MPWCSLWQDTRVLTLLTLSPSYSGVNVEAKTARQLAEALASMCLLLALSSARMELRAVFQAGGIATGMQLEAAILEAARASFDALPISGTAR